MSFLTNGPSASQSRYNFSPTIGAESGFGENFAAAFNESTAAYSQFGLEFSMLDEDEKNDDLIYELTGERLASFNEAISLYLRAAKEAEGETPEPLPSHLLTGGSTSPQDWFKEYQKKRKRLEELKKQYPQISTYEEMWGRVKTDAQKKTAIAQESFKRAGGLGSTGFFAGSMAGAFTYRDPVNLATLGVGGFGRTVLRRIGTEMGLQALIEAQNQFFGVAENRRLLGLKHTGGDMAFHIGAASVGGGAFRGLFEGVGAGLKKIQNRDGQAAARMSMRDLADNLSDPERLRGQPSEARAAALANEIDAENAARNPYSNDGSGTARSRDLFDRTRKELESWGTSPHEPVPPHRAAPEGEPTSRDFMLEEAEGVIELMRRAPQGLKASELSKKLGQKVVSLSRFIKNRGGLVDQGGELASRDVTNRSLPGLVRKQADDAHPTANLENTIVWFQGKSARAGEGRPIYAGDVQRALDDELRATDAMADEYDKMGITSDMTPEQVGRILHAERTRGTPDDRPPEIRQDEMEAEGRAFEESEAYKEHMDDTLHRGRSHAARIADADRASQTIDELEETIDVDVDNSVQRLADEGIEETDEVFEFAVVDRQVTLVPRTVKSYLDEFEADESLDAVLEACVK